MKGAGLVAVSRQAEDEARDGPWLDVIGRAGNRN